MKVIFLDIDGVLNHQKWYKTRIEIKQGTDNKDWSDRYPFYEFDPESVKVLNYIIENTGAKVVISSTWRHGRTVSDLQHILNSVGFNGEIIDTTPSLNARIGKESAGYTVPRGCEIDWWLDNHGKFQRINWSQERQQEYIDKAEVKNYVILDDDSDMLFSQREHFVQTSWEDGLTNEKANKVIEILNKTLIELYY